MKRFVQLALLGCISLVSGSSLTQQKTLTMSGFVYDKRSRPLEGARVTIVGDKAKADTTTDSDGRFVVNFAQGVEEGNSVRIHVEKIGYRIHEEWVAVNSTIPLRLSLELGKGTPLPPKAERPRTETISVQFRMQFVDTSRRLDTSLFWVQYSSAYGETLSPVAVLAYVSVTSTYAHPISISSYSLELESRTCQWEKLVPMPALLGPLLWNLGAPGNTNGTDFKRMAQIQTVAAFEDIWKVPMQPYEEKFGALLFDAPTRCDLDIGDHLRFRLTLLDSTDAAHVSTSPDLTITKLPSLDSSIGHSNTPVLYFTGFETDASGAYRRFYSDPIPVSIPEKLKNTGFVTSKRVRNAVSVVADEGTFMCECARPKGSKDNQ